MKRAALSAALVALSACASEPRVNPASQPAPPAQHQSEPARVTTPAQAPVRNWAVSRNGAEILFVSSAPGPIVDGNAPPPPPNQPTPAHPFLSASCTGSPADCSQCGEMLRASQSLDEFLGKLRAAGFEVRELPPGR